LLVVLEKSREQKPADAHGWGASPARSLHADQQRQVDRAVGGSVPAEMHVGERCRACGSTIGPVYVAARS